MLAALFGFIGCNLPGTGGFCCHGPVITDYPARGRRMTRIAHLSDIHFGAHDSKIVAATEAWLQKHRPDLVIISGDFTQRAKAAEFRAASAYLNRLKAAGLRVLSIPGNHDIPLYDVVRRFATPLDRYKKYIDNDLCPWFEDDDVAVLGINTARSLTIRDGRINNEQIRMMHERFGPVAGDKMRILVTHHPLFSMPIGDGGALSEAVGRHESAVLGASAVGVHIALAGHFHQTFAEAPGRMVEKSGSILVIQAGTATSVRLRNDEPQSFNWLEIERPNVLTLKVVPWDGASFVNGSERRYKLGSDHWQTDEPVYSNAMRHPLI
jgi:3',5'-cyclic AMP phosphodiesterase CpdA